MPRATVAPARNSRSVGRPDFSDVPPSRRRNMAAIRGRDTGPEMTLRKVLFGMGYRYRLHVKGLPGRPDLAFPGRRKLVFVHGCFWHRHEGCRNSRLPRARRDWWAFKLKSNVDRDARNLAFLADAGWQSLVVWECELTSPNVAADRVSAFLGPPVASRIAGPC